MPGMPKFTKTPPAVLAAFEAAAPKRADVARKTMFGYPALFVNGNMFAFTFGPQVAVRLGTKAGAKPFEIMPGRAMGDYVAVPESAVKGAGLKSWIADALTYTEAMPAKRKAGAKKTRAKTVQKTTAKKR